jgi:hypothetical protein
MQRLSAAFLVGAAGLWMFIPTDKSIALAALPAAHLQGTRQMARNQRDGLNRSCLTCKAMGRRALIKRYRLRLISPNDDIAVAQDYAERT